MREIENSIQIPNYFRSESHFINYIYDKVERLEAKFNRDYDTTKIVKLLKNRIGIRNTHNLVTIKKAAEEIYSKENIDIKFHFGNPIIRSSIEIEYPNLRGSSDILHIDYIEGIEIPICNITLTIRFPKIVIKNELGDKHIIEDLFLHINFDVDSVNGLTFDKLVGNRLTFQHIEKYVGYVHSHIRTNRSKELEFEKFCVGYGELGASILNINSILVDKNEILNIDEATIFFLLIRSYIEWESLSGVPFIKIKDISYKKEICSSSAIDINDINLYVNQLLNASQELKLTWEEGENFYFYIRSINILEDYIIKYCTLSNDYIVYTDQNYNLYSMPEENININNLYSDASGETEEYYEFSKYGMIFKGELIPLKIYKYRGLNLTCSHPKPHPHVTNLIKNQLEIYANQKRIENITFRAKSKDNS